MAGYGRTADIAGGTERYGRQKVRFRARQRALPTVHRHSTRCIACREAVARAGGSSSAHVLFLRLRRARHCHGATRCCTREKDRREAEYQQEDAS